MPPNSRLATKPLLEFCRRWRLRLPTPAGLGIIWCVSLTCLFLSSAGTVLPADVASNDFPGYGVSKVPADAKKGLGSWIWTDKTFDRQTCRLWKEFDVPSGSKVNSARMRMTVDDGYQLFLDGRELGQGAEWRTLTEYDLTLLLPPGHHVLAVNAFNDLYFAGLIMDLKIQFSDGGILDIKSDNSWWVVPGNEHGWEAITHPRPGWQSATVCPTNDYWSSPSWPSDILRVPPFAPIITPFWQTGWFHFLLASGCGLILLICVALIVQLAIQRRQHQLLDRERARIARDIHDDFGTRLSWLVLEGELAQNEQVDNPSARLRFSRINSGLREALGAMDEVLWAVNPRRDTVRDFVSYVCEYAHTFLQSTPIQCLLEVESNMPALEFDLPLRRSLLLAVKEAINNAAKHSNAGKVTLQIYRREPGLTVIVADNGKGFDPAGITGVRNGLGNMIQRMQDVGGKCRIVSEPAKGCRVEFSLPLTRRLSRFDWLTRHWHRYFDNERNIVQGGGAPRQKYP